MNRLQNRLKFVLYLFTYRQKYVSLLKSSFKFALLNLGNVEQLKGFHFSTCTYIPSSSTHVLEFMHAQIHANLLKLQNQQNVEIGFTLCKYFGCSEHNSISILSELLTDQLFLLGIHQPFPHPLGLQQDSPCRMLKVQIVQNCQKIVNFLKTSEAPTAERYVNFDF